MSQMTNDGNGGNNQAQLVFRSTNKGGGEAGTSSNLTAYASSPESDISSEVTRPFGWDFELSLEAWTGVLFGVVCVWVLISFVLGYFCGPDFVTCYLCQRQVPRRYWLSGEHRNECAKANEKFLDQLPTGNLNTRCPICYRPLKVWPADLGPKEFICMSRYECQEVENGLKKPTINNGETRLNCYNCDYDLCNSCASGNEPNLSRKNTNGWLNDRAGRTGSVEMGLASIGTGFIRQNKIMEESPAAAAKAQQRF